MARNRSRRSRDTSVVANQVWLRSPSSVPLSDLRQFFLPQALDPWLDLSGVPARVYERSRTAQRSGYRGSRSPAFSSYVVHAFRAPARVAVCVRRRQRREVLLAKGRGGRGFKKPRWKERSHISCR